MKHTACLFTLGTLAVLAVAEMSPIAQSTVPPGFVSIFNGRDLTGWKIPEGDNGHWKVVDGVIDYDAGSEAPGNKNLWTEKAYRNFEFKAPVPIRSPALNCGPRPRRANANRNIGEWNTFEITAIGNTLRLVHNGKEVIPTITLPDLPAGGPIGLQHHGSNKNGVYGGIPALVQFRNIYVKELP
jgi:hypothetical protein